MTKKQILRAVAFLLAVCVLLVVLCDLFEQENHQSCDRSFYTYRTYPENIIDAVYIGTSGVDNYWIAPQAYEEYGLTVHPLATEAMPPWLYTNMMDEALAYQSPELILLDIRAFTQASKLEESFDFMTIDACARRVLDAMDLFSLNRLKTAFKVMEVVHELDETAPRWDISYLFSFVKYHSKWSDEEYRFSSNLGQRAHKYCGFNANDAFSTAQVPQTPVVYDSTYIEDLDPLCEAALYEVLDYIREKDLQVLFVDTPQFLARDRIGRTNRVLQILEEEGMDYLTFYTDAPDGSFAIDLDPETDFHDSAHVNYFGAQKYTAALGAYIHGNYDLPDRRNDENAVASWGGVYDSLNEYIASLPILHSRG